MSLSGYGIRRWRGRARAGWRHFAQAAGQESVQRQAGDLGCGVARALTVRIGARPAWIPVSGM